MNERRYENHYRLDHFNPELQQKIQNTRVLVIGAGGLGCPLLINLAMLGIGHIRLVDDDIIHLNNLNRQFFFSEKEVGNKKIQIAEKFLKSFRPDLNLELQDRRFNSENAEELLDGIHYAIDCSDNLATRYTLDKFCSELKVPMIFGGVRKFEGQIGVFHWKTQTRFDEVFPPSAEVFAAEDCNMLGTTGFVCQQVASWQCAELFKMISGQGNVLEGTLLMLDQLEISHLKIQHS